MGVVKSIARTYTANEYLFWYIEKKDLPKIEQLLDKRPEIVDQPLTSSFKTTPLHRAAVNGSLPVVQLLIEKYSAQVDHQTEAGETALMGAAKRNQTGVVRYLLTMGANPDCVSGCGLKAIEYSILAGFYESAQVLYEKMKDRDLKEVADYEQLGAQFQYRYVNYKIFLDGLKMGVDADNLPDFLKREKKVYEDPVVDPRESWKQWFLRNMEFKDPPLCERNDLPEELQPQNRKFGKVSHFFSRLAMTHMTQKPSFKPQNQTEAASNDKIQVKRAAMSENL